MVNTEKFFKALQSIEIDFYTGVPDSLLKDICAYISDNVPEENHIIAVNEGASVGLAIGYYLATNKIALVYMQNSGLGNAVNPLLSIADEKVYGIPMILLIGWRGEPGIKDEPQHIKQGEVTEKMLSAMDIPYTNMSASSDYTKILSQAMDSCKRKSKPYAIIVKKDSFEKYNLKKDIKTHFELCREDAIKLIIDTLENDDVVVSTTGKTSREVFEYRKKLGHTHEKDFLTVGAMGHTSSIALGISIGNKNKNIYCIDGDGSTLMHMGSLAINGLAKRCKNFKHIVINNGAHDSVGGQPTVALKTDFCRIAKACNYTFVDTANSAVEIKNKVRQIKSHKGRSFLEIKVNKGARENLGRPTISPNNNKMAFQKFLEL